MTRKKTAPADPLPVSQPDSPQFAKILQSPGVAIGALAIVVVVLFAGFLFSDAMLFESDQTSGLNARVLIKETLRETGAPPLWLTSILGGMPTFDASFGDVLYAPSFIVDALFPIHRALGLKIVLHVFLAGLFFFLMMWRGFRAPPWISFAAALFYMLNPQFVSHVYSGHDGKMYVIAWLPFVVWRMKTLMEVPSLRNGSLLALGIAFSLLTAHVQMTYFVLWGLFFYWVLAVVLHWNREHDKRLLLFRSGYFWVAVFFGIGIAFVQFYPVYAFVNHAFSVRGVDRGFEYAASWSLHWPEILSLWVPDFCGDSVGQVATYWSENPFKLNSEYAGAMALMLGALAVVSRPSAWRFLWASVALFGVAYALGAHSFVFHVAYAIIPGVKKFRACSMIMFWFSFATALLAGLFLFDLSRGRFRELGAERRKKWTRGLLIAAGACTLLAVLFSLRGFVDGLMTPLVATLGNSRQQQIFADNFTANFVPFLWVWWLFAMAVFGVLAAHVQGKAPVAAVLALVIVIGLIDTFRVDSRFIKSVDARNYFYTPPELKQLAARMTQEPFRVFSFPETFQQQNAEGIHGLEGVGGFHDNELCWYRTFRGDQRDINYFTGLIGYQNGQPYLNADRLPLGNNFLNLANVRYYLGRQSSGIVVIPNPSALGRISFASRYVKLDTGAAVAALRNNSYDIRTTVALTEEPDFKPAPSPADSAAPAMAVTWRKYNANIRAVHVSVPRDGFLRISEVYYPAWEVRIDGKRQRIYQADVAWMAVAVTKGDHDIEITPHSLYLKSAVMVSAPLAGLMALYWIVLFARRATRKKPAVAAAPS